MQDYKYQGGTSMLLGWLVYQERKYLPQDLARQLKAAFISETDARQYASLMKNVSVMAGYKDNFVVKKSDIVSLSLEA